MNVGVAILRLQEGLDCSEFLGDIDDVILNKSSGKTSESTSRLSQGRENSIISDSNLLQTPNHTSASSTITLFYCQPLSQWRVYIQFYFFFS